MCANFIYLPHKFFAYEVPIFFHCPCFGLGGGSCLVRVVCRYAALFVVWLRRAQYQYVVKPSNSTRERLRSEYINMWLGQKAQRKVVPPGLSADYGLLLYRDGQREDGLSYLRKEVELYPESKTYVERLIKKLEGE